MKRIAKIYSPIKFLTTVIVNILTAYVIFGICRLVFYLSNIEYFPNIGFQEVLQILKGGLVFDTAGIIYVNILYIALMLIPLPWRETLKWQNICKWIFVVTNSIVIIVNFIDTVYFQYTNRRSTASVFSEFKGEDNLLKVFGTEIVQNWLLVIIAIALIYTIYKLYLNPIREKSNKKKKHSVKYIIAYYTSSLLIFVLTIPLCIAGIRGGFAHSTRPITIGNANQYVNRPIETAIVLNTPFSIIRTIGKKVYENPNYFNKEELNKIYTPIHSSTDKNFNKLNVVVIILESFGQEYVEYGYAPFLTSLQEKGLYFKNAFSNGRKSIDGMPSVLSSIPMFIEPYFTTHYANNNISSIANELNKQGYHSAFFHGAPNGSMGFLAFAKATGWKEYYGMDEYANSADFDGMWAIWDEPFMQFFADKLSTFKEPFVASIFTASSHHPYKIPKEYEAIYTEEGDPIHKCIRYTDNALKKFFEKAQKEEWFKNTLFVITADHTNASSHQEYMTDTGIFRVPIIFLFPNNEYNECSSKVAQQIDIMPTILNYLNYPTPYIAFGKNLLDSNPNNNWVINYNNGFYQYFEGDYLLQFDGEKPFALYNYNSDNLLKENVLNEISEQDNMLNRCKAIIQEYIERMINDNLIINK
ncbi:MAG: sulfatase-like hydrolase/transferase [Bacteroidales bacterium]|nr:sulfatase-like hydrolase/transferase [Bacteroidales bacterium]